MAAVGAGGVDVAKTRVKVEKEADVLAGLPKKRNEKNLANFIGWGN